MAHEAKSSNALRSNFDVDYVIIYRFTDTDQVEAQANFEKLLKALARVGLQMEVRDGDNCSVLVLVKAESTKRFNNAVYRSRVKDWLHGVRPAQPDRDAHNSTKDQALTDGERYRLIHHIITVSKEEGGAGITPKHGEWENVESVYPIHDPAFNKEWIKKWSTTSFLKAKDLDEIRDKLGEKVAFYFAFTQSYFSFLIFPAAFGFAAWVLLGHYSGIYAVVNTLWCVTFVEYWKKQESDLAMRWGVKGVSTIQEKRKEFKYEKVEKDRVTGELVQVYPASKRLTRQALIIPFAVLAVLALGTIIVVCFGIEVFLSEVYNGPFKSGLVFLPTGLLITLIPTFSTLLTDVATRLNDLENWETYEQYEAAMTEKTFVLNFITSYLGVFLTAFVYVPFGSILVPYLDVFGLAAKPIATSDHQLKAPPSGSFKINPARLRHQVIYLAVTAQIVNFFLENVVPYIKRKGSDKYEAIKTERAVAAGGAPPPAGMNDHPEEAEFLARVRSEANLAVYDVNDDIREMVDQFGYLALFSVVWPLVPVSFFVNNWIELRSDAAKICVEMQRPIPYRADGIGPWLDNLGFLVWLGSITNAALVYLFSNDGLGPDGTPATIKGWALLLTVFFSEHIYLVVRLAVRFIISKLDSPGMEKEKAELYLVRKRYLEESVGDDEDGMDLPAGKPRDEPITRESLEEDARQGSLRTSSQSDKFWGRQRGWEESLIVGKGLIEKSKGMEKKKSK